MRLILTLLIVSLSLGVFAQTTRIIKPSDTDPAIEQHNTAHVVYPPTGAAIDRLLIFLPGTGGLPIGYRKFMEEASRVGYHVIGLEYINDIAINAVCATSTDITCPNRARQEVIYGTNTHETIDVDVTNSVMNRLHKLLAKLQTDYPSENWETFLVDDSLNWSKTAWAGHSQGGGHAGIIGHWETVNRVIMMGSLDAVPGAAALGEWMTPNGATCTCDYFGFAHQRDQAAGYNGQKLGWQALEMRNANNPIFIDDLNEIPSETRCFYTNLTPGGDTSQYHGATTVDPYLPLNTDNEPIYQTIWNYMLSAPNLATHVIQTADFQLHYGYPNPTSGIIHFSENNWQSVKINDVTGKVVMQVSQPFTTLDISHLKNGVYQLILVSETGSTTTRITKQ